MPISPELLGLLEGDMGLSIRNQSQEVGLAHARQRDGAASDMRALGAAVAVAMLQADEPTTFAGINAGVRTPDTLDHPGNTSGNAVPTLK